MGFSIRAVIIVFDVPRERTLLLEDGAGVVVEDRLMLRGSDLRQQRRFFLHPLPVCDERG